MFWFHPSKVCHMEAKPEWTTWLHRSNTPILCQFISAFMNTTFLHFPKALRHSLQHQTTTTPIDTFFYISNSKTIIPPISMQSLNFDTVVADRSLILSACIHVALYFSHNDAKYSIFWGSNTTSYLRGMSTRKYPSLGWMKFQTLPKPFQQECTCTRLWQQGIVPSLGIPIHRPTPQWPKR